MNPFEHVPKEQNPDDESLEAQLNRLTVRKAEIQEEMELAAEAGNDEKVKMLDAELKTVLRDLPVVEAGVQGKKGGFDWLRHAKEDQG